MSAIHTFTLDRRNILIPSPSHVGYALLDYVLKPARSWIRGKDARFVYTVDASGSGYIWMTNRELFYRELWEFMKQQQQNNPDKDTGILYKGLQFDTTSSGRFFKVHTFVCGSIRHGGFADNVY